jgi:DNA repair protein RadC
MSKQSDINDNEATVTNRAHDAAGQWEAVARYLAFRFMNMPGEVFELICKDVKQKYIEGKE